MLVNLKDRVTNCKQLSGSHLIRLFMYQLHTQLIRYSHSLWPISPHSFLPTVIIPVYPLPCHPYLPASYPTTVPFSFPRSVLHSRAQKTAAHRPSQPAFCFFMANKPRFFLIFILLHFKWLYKYLHSSLKVSSWPLKLQIFTICPFAKEFAHSCLALIGCISLKPLTFCVRSSHKLLFLA